MQRWTRKHSTESAVASITAFGPLSPSETLAIASSFLAWAGRQRLAAAQQFESMLANPGASRDAILRSVEVATSAAVSAAAAAAQAGCRVLEEVAASMSIGVGDDDVFMTSWQ